SANRNCPTNSGPYGYGGLIAATIVLPVRIIMFPTSSKTFLVGRNARSATARINWSLVLPKSVRRLTRGLATKPTAPVALGASWNRREPPREANPPWYFQPPVSGWRTRSCCIVAGIGAALALGACGG